MSAQGEIRMGKEAHHNLGDISRDEWDYFRVDGQDAENYYGHWLAGFGFIDVRFPKATTRPMNPAEREYLSNCGWELA